MIGKLRLLFWIGVALLFIPYVGIFHSWKNGITILLGILIIYLTFKIRRDYKMLRFKMRRYERIETETVEGEQHHG